MAVHEIKRSAIVPFSPAQMFDLVADVASYPAFVPWCTGAELIESEQDLVVGRLGMSQGPLVADVTTRNEHDRPHAITMLLVDGPFRELTGQWRFDAVGEGGCEVSLELAFQFTSPLKDWLLSAVFEEACARMIAAFVERAEALYG